MTFDQMSDPADNEGGKHTKDCVWREIEGHSQRARMLHLEPELERKELPCNEGAETQAERRSRSVSACRCSCTLLLTSRR